MEFGVVGLAGLLVQVSDGKAGGRFVLDVELELAVAAAPRSVVSRPWPRSVRV
jgi:hypothetical protein